MEILDLYDGKCQRTGKTIERGSKNIGEDEHIMLAVVWVKCKGKYLLQKTSVEKGGEYAVSGGHVPAGTSAIEQAHVELEEELALNILQKDLKHLGHIVRPHVIFSVYLYENDSLENFNFVLQDCEVESVAWYSKKQIESLINKGLLRKSTQMQYETFIKTMA